MRRLVQAVPALVAEVKRLRANQRDDLDELVAAHASDPEFLAHYRAAREMHQAEFANSAAVERVRALHRHLTDEQGIEYCEWCDDNGADYGHELPLWPCPTIRALDGAT